MVRRAYTQRSLIEVLLPDSEKRWDSSLRQIDALLDDEELVDRIAEALPRRHPQSRRRGRLGTPAAVVLRTLVLKHLHDWSFDACEREVRGNLVALGRERRLLRGRRLRLVTTVVETTMHYPTDGNEYSDPGHQLFPAPRPMSVVISVPESN